MNPIKRDAKITSGHREIPEFEIIECNSYGKKWNREEREK